jgi:hypothetical protein
VRHVVIMVNLFYLNAHLGAHFKTREPAGQ